MNWLFSVLIVSNWQPAQAAGPGDRIERMMAAGNQEKALIVCQKLEERGVVMGDPKAKALCARVQFQQLRKQRPAESTLEMFARKWSNTPTSTRIVANLWERASRRGTIFACQEFQRKWPTSPQASMARAKEFELAYAKAQAANTPDSWKLLLESYPTHPRAQDAHRSWQESAFQHAKAQDSQDGWKTMLAEWPQHPRKSEIQNLLNAVAFRDARQSNTVEGWSRFLSEYPDHPQIEAGKVGLNDAAFQRAVTTATTAGWDLFLRDFPSHPRIVEGKERRMNTIFLAAQQGGEEGVAKFAQDHPDDPMSAVIRGLAFQDKVTGKVRHVRGNVEIAPKMGQLELWHRNIEVRASGLKVAKVELVALHQQVPRVIPYAANWSEIQVREGISKDIEIDGLTMEWTRSGSTWKAKLPYPVCTPTTIGSYLGVAVHLSGTAKPTTVVRPIKTKLKCSQLQVGDSTFSSMQDAISDVSTTLKIRPTDFDDDMGMDVGKRARLPRDVNLNGVPCKGGRYVEFLYDSSWGCELSAPHTPWGAPQAIPAGRRITIQYGSGVQLEFGGQYGSGLQFGDIACTSGTWHASGTPRVCELARAHKIGSTTFQPGEIFHFDETGAINLVRTSREFRIGGITCVNGGAEVKRGRLTKCLDYVIDY